MKGRLATGTWKLQILDDQFVNPAGGIQADLGSLLNWSLSIQTATATPLPQAGNLMDQNQNAVTAEPATFAATSVTIDNTSLSANYSVGDILVVIGGTLAGTPTQRTELQVTSIGAGGTVTGVKVYQAGAYSQAPTNPLHAVDITGSGGGAAFDVTYTGTPGDIFAIPTPTDGPPFQLPYSQDTLPLIIPGPHNTSSSVALIRAAAQRRPTTWCSTAPVVPST